MEGWRRALLIPLCALLASAACGSDSSPSNTSSLAPTATGASASPATETPSIEDLGPLAVIDTDGGSTAGGGTGRVTIGESCVTMTRANGDVVLLIWHLADVAWNEQRQQITFTGHAGPPDGPVAVRDGDTITIGGEALESDQPIERELAWVATPAPSCAGLGWFVDYLSKP